MCYSEVGHSDVFCCDKATECIIEAEHQLRTVRFQHVSGSNPSFVCGNELKIELTHSLTSKIFP